MVPKNKLTLLEQRGALKSYFPDALFSAPSIHHLTFTHWVQPTALSIRYQVQLVHNRGESPKVYVLDPKPLALHPGRTSLPHVYSHADQRLCLYDPVEHEWTADMFHVHTTLPWTVEWLMHYEIWVGTGTWNGGGTNHTSDKSESSAA